MKATRPGISGTGTMNRYPLRGIYSEIAQEEGVSRQAIQQAARKGNPRILNRIAEKVEERKARIKQKREPAAGRRGRGSPKK